MSWLLRHSLIDRVPCGYTRGPEITWPGSSQRKASEVGCRDVFREINTYSCLSYHKEQATRRDFRPRQQKQGGNNLYSCILNPLPHGCVPVQKYQTKANTEIDY